MQRARAPPSEVWELHAASSRDTRRRCALARPGLTRGRVQKPPPFPLQLFPGAPSLGLGHATMELCRAAVSPSRRGACAPLCVCSGVIGDAALFEDDLVDYSPVDDSSSAMLMSTPKRKRPFSDVLRGIKVHEETLQCIVGRLGGGIQGLEALMEHINHWAMVSEDADVVTTTITRGIMDLGTPPTPKRHCNLGIGSPKCEDNACDLNFNVPRDTFETTVNHEAAHTRALRKAHMVRQRGQARLQRHHSVSKCGDQWRQWRPSSSPQLSHDVEPKFSTRSAKGYEYLFQKELRASDVSSLGRIVLPKKDAENHLPYLSVREGIMVSFEDYYSEKIWTVRYRFWPNNKSRMYLLENIGAFVNYHHLQEGDLLLCYRNQYGGYVIRGQKVRTIVQTSPKCQNSKGVQPRECTATEMKTVTTVLPSVHQQLVEGESTLSNSCFDSLNYTIRDFGDGNYFQDGYSHYQRCFSQQTGYEDVNPLSCEDALRTDSSASCKPPVPGWGSDPVVDMVTVTNLKQGFMDENLFLE